MVSSKSWHSKRAHGGLSALDSLEAVSVLASGSLVMVKVGFGGWKVTRSVVTTAEMLPGQTEL